MKIVLIADTWEPDLNGVATALKTLYDQLVKLDHDVFLIHPGMFDTVPCPGFDFIRIAKHPEYLRFVLKNLKFDSLHIATEGPIGWAARDYCIESGITFTTAYHFNYPEFLKTKFKIPLWLTYRLLRKFHRNSAKVLVNSLENRQLLETQGFKRVEVLTVDQLAPNKADAIKFLKLQAFKYDVVVDD